MIDSQLSARRQVLLTVAGGFVLFAGGTMLCRSAAAAADTTAAIKEKIADRIAENSSKINLDLPQIAENGNTVPIRVRVDSPMLKEDYVKAVHLFADGNPLPNVASFYFSPKSGRAEAKTRMRLAKTQNVIAVAEMSSGKVLMNQAMVKVTIGGCGG